MNEIEGILELLGIVGAFGVPALAIVLYYRHQRRKRELEHIERLRAIEAGLTLPQDEPLVSTARVGAFLAIVVPIGVFIPAWLVTGLAGYHDEIWVAVTMVALAAVICGTILVRSALRKGTRAAGMVVKPYVEEDAYDVVSSRG